MFCHSAVNVTNENAALEQETVRDNAEQETVQIENLTRAQLSLGLADRTHGAHSQPASITVL